VYLGRCRCLDAHVTLSLARVSRVGRAAALDPLRVSSLPMFSAGSRHSTNDQTLNRRTYTGRAPVQPPHTIIHSLTASWHHRCNSALYIPKLHTLAVARSARGALYPKAEPVHPHILRRSQPPPSSDSRQCSGTPCIRRRRLRCHPAA
jgi:hypothetical protein